MTNVSIYRPLPVGPVTRLMCENFVISREVTETLATGDVVEFEPGGRGGIYRGIEERSSCAIFDHVDCAEIAVLTRKAGS